MEENVVMKRVVIDNTIVVGGRVILPCQVSGGVQIGGTFPGVRWFSGLLLNQPTIVVD